MSGEKCFDVLNKIFKPKKQESVENIKGYTIKYGHIVENEEIIDEVLVSYFKAPRSYTTENMCEINTHGGNIVIRKILDLCLKNGANLAEPGEFTKRAFLNGKMSLTQAEAVMDIISSGGESQLRYANALKDGAVFRRINKIKEGIVNILADLAAWADFPEEDVPEVKPEVLGVQIDRVVKDLIKTLDTYDHGRIVREGINTVICGKPNVGKSTLMNCLSGYQRSIVTDIAGTTRDIIEENVRIGELTLRLSDTAGIRETDDIIESMGVDIAYKKIDEADLILAVFDSTSELESKDFEIIEKLKNKNCIAVINKIDGKTKIDKDFIYSNFKNTVEISAKNDEGIERLQKILEDMFLYDKSEASDGIIANERQKNCIEKALSNAIEAKTILENGEMLDAVTVMLDSAADNLMELTGEKSSEKVIDDVFSRFCVGK